MTRVARFYAGWGVLLVALAVTLQSGYAWFQITHTNQLISRLNQGKAITPAPLKNAAPELQLAYAAYLKKKHRYQDAQAVLSRIINQGSRQIQTITRYNLGNIYLSEAIELAEAMQINDAMALAALAKQAYRQALALDSQYWDAKYNLEVAMRLLPEMDRITMDNDEPVPEKKNRLWATVPGFPRGLP